MDLPKTELTRVNRKVLSYFMKASPDQRYKMINVLREQIENLDLLMIEMEKEITK